jgi:hypothetical protein
VAGLDPDDECDRGRRSDPQRRQVVSGEPHEPDASEPADRRREDRAGRQPEPERDHEHQHEQRQREQLEQAELAPQPVPGVPEHRRPPADLDVEGPRIELLPKLRNCSLLRGGVVVREVDLERGRSLVARDRPPPHLGDVGVGLDLGRDHVERDLVHARVHPVSPGGHDHHSRIRFAFERGAKLVRGAVAL